MARLPAGCRFQPRCPHAVDKCTQVAPELVPIDEALVRCLRRQDGTLPAPAGQEGSLSR
jgi:ABC-type dipeptide/oligopeptide/nickel transport system ATPase component